MRLFIIRHCEAAAGAPDDLRPLTGAGREHARELGTRFAADGIRPAAVVSSPLLRARETADAIASAVGMEAVVDERLAPGASPDDFRGVANDHGDTVVAVGHQPDCGSAAATLSGGPEPRFPPGGVFAVEL